MPCGPGLFLDPSSCACSARHDARHQGQQAGGQSLRFPQALHSCLPALQRCAHQGHRQRRHLHAGDQLGELAPGEALCRSRRLVQQAAIDVAQLYAVRRARAPAQPGHHARRKAPLRSRARAACAARPHSCTQTYTCVLVSWTRSLKNHATVCVSTHAATPSCASSVPGLMSPDLRRYSLSAISGMPLHQESRGSGSQSKCSALGHP